jgi:hypothetical protein
MGGTVSTQYTLAAADNYQGATFFDNWVFNQTNLAVSRYMRYLNMN